MKAYVYILQLLPSGVFYIGSTGSLDKRIARHLKELNDGTHHNQILQENWSDEVELSYDTIEFDDRNKAYECEELAIRRARLGPRKHLLANIGNSAIGGDNMSHHPDSQQLKESRSNQLRTFVQSLSKEDKKRIYGKTGSSNPMFGKTHSEQARKRISEMHKGHSYNKGIKLSQSHIEKIRERQKLRVGEKNSFYNKRHSEKTKALLRSINLGKINPNGKQVYAGGIMFRSQCDAAKHYKIGVPLVAYRVKSKHFKDWYLQKDESRLTNEAEG